MPPALKFISIPLTANYLINYVTWHLRIDDWLGRGKITSPGLLLKRYAVNLKRLVFEIHRILSTLQNLTE